MSSPMLEAPLDNLLDNFARVVEQRDELLAACEEVLRTCALWRKADNMAGRICSIVEPAIAKCSGEAVAP